MSNNEVQITRFLPQKATSQEWEQRYTLYIKEHEELYPIYPRLSLEKTKKRLLNPDPGYQTDYWFLSLKGDESKVIGRGQYDYFTDKHPGYEENKHVAFGMIYIDPEYRGQGYGTALLRTLVENLKQDGKEVFQVGPLYDDGLKFSKRFEGIFALKEEVSLLRLAEVNWDMVNNWRSPDATKAKGVTVKTFESVPEALIDQYCMLYTETLNQIPLGELEREFKETPETRRIAEERMKMSERVWTTIITTEQDGTISGLTETFYDPENAEVIGQGLTSVKTEYRGRGMGKLLKAEMLHFIKMNFPTVERIITDFAVTNEPMIAINRRLGFHNAREMVYYKFNVNKIEKQLL